MGGDGGLGTWRARGVKRWDAGVGGRGNRGLGSACALGWGPTRYGWVMVQVEMQNGATSSRTHITPRFASNNPTGAQPLDSCTPALFFNQNCKPYRSGEQHQVDVIYWVSPPPNIAARSLAYTQNTH